MSLCGPVYEMGCLHSTTSESLLGEFHRLGPGRLTPEFLEFYKPVPGFGRVWKTTELCAFPYINNFNGYHFFISGLQCPRREWC